MPRLGDSYAKILKSRASFVATKETRQYPRWSTDRPLGHWSMVGLASRDYGLLSRCLPHRPTMTPPFSCPASDEAEIFWTTKGAKTRRIPSMQKAGGELVYPA